MIHPGWWWLIAFLASLALWQLLIEAMTEALR